MVPAVTSDGLESRFSFSLSNVDADGPQGSFECIRTTAKESSRSFGRNRLENMGKMEYKMQVHASDDSYQKTKAKMSFATEESKKHSTKVIKESGPNVGRKVKVKKAAHQTNSSAAYHKTAVVNSGSQVSRHNDHYVRPPSPPALKLNGKDLLSNGSGSSSGGHLSRPTVQSSNSAASSSKASSSIPSSSSQSTSPAVSSGHPVNSDLLRRPLKERLVHLLALRPFKKPELLAKLNKDGIREKDKKGLSILLNTVATIKENAFHIARHAWHEVQVDEWPHYTAEERDLVRQRSPLLVPPPTQAQPPSQAVNSRHHMNSALSPLSSDCSSVQASPSPPVPSPQDGVASSLHNGQVKRSVTVDSQLTEQPNLKRSRVSHVSNPTSSSSLSSNRSKSPSVGLQTNGYHDLISGWANKPKSPEPNSQESRASSNSNVVSRSSSGWTDLRPADASSHNKTNHPSPDSNGIHSSLSSSSAQASQSVVCATMAQSTVQQQQQTHTNGSGNHTSSSSSAAISKKSSKHSQQSFSSSSSARDRDRESAQTRDHRDQSASSKQHTANLPTTTTMSSTSCSISSSTNLLVSSTSQQHERTRGQSRNSRENVTGHPHFVSPDSSPDSGTGSNDGSLSSGRSYCSSVNGDHQTRPGTTNGQTELITPSNECLNQADYIMQYREINNLEQRARYKQDFGREYQEYRKLHAKVDEVAKQFQSLEERLKNSQEGSDEWNVGSFLILGYLARSYILYVIRTYSNSCLLHDNLVESNGDNND